MLQPVPDYKKGDEPATLHKVMRAMIGEGLRAHYEAPQKLSHELFVLLMQLNEQERVQKKAPRARRASSPGLTRRSRSDRHGIAT